MRAMNAAPPAPDCTVLVPSCDAYADLWTPFATLFFRHWPDCPFPVALGSNDLPFSHPRVRTIHAGHGTNWANRVRQQLESLDTPYVLVMLEDFLLRAAVDTSLVLRCLESLVALDGDMLRLVPRPGPDDPVPGHPHIGRIAPGAPYRVSTQGAFWRREALLALMRPDESIWDFELSGSRRSDERPGFYAVWRPVLPYRHHVVERGKWFPWDARRFRRMDVGCDFERRGIMAPREAAVWLLKRSIARGLETLPWRRRAQLVRGVRSLQGAADRSGS
jgi:hypothetical protein